MQKGSSQTHSTKRDELNVNDQFGRPDLSEHTVSHNEDVRHGLTTVLSGGAAGVPVARDQSGAAARDPLVKSSESRASNVRSAPSKFRQDVHPEAKVARADPQVQECHSWSGLDLWETRQPSYMIAGGSLAH